MTAAGDEQDKNVEISNQNFNSISEDPKIEQNDVEEEELRRLLLPKVDELPQVPPSAVEDNFTTCFAPERTAFICCVKGYLLEVNERLIKQPELLNMTAEREGYVAVMMPKPADWLKAKASLLDSEGYRKLRMEQ